MATTYSDYIKHGAKNFTYDDLDTYDTVVGPDGKTVGSHTYDELGVQSYSDQTKNSTSYSNQTKN